MGKTNLKIFLLETTICHKQIYNEVGQYEPVIRDVRQGSVMSPDLFFPYLVKILLLYTVYINEVVLQETTENKIDVDSKNNLDM